MKIMVQLMKNLPGKLIHRFSLVMLLLCSGPPGFAVMLDATGRGEVLIIPYYTVQGGQQTLLSIVNHANAAKALKLRFRESFRGREVASLNLYLGAYDIWTAALLADATSVSATRLLTFDRSCTVPDIRTSTTLPTLPNGTRALPFSSSSFTGANADSNFTDPVRMREGYVEIIEMGELVRDSEAERAATASGGFPGSCATLVARWQPGGIWVLDPTADLAPPQGDVSATASLLQVAESKLFQVPATALSRFSISVQHSSPVSELPDLGSAITEPGAARTEALLIAHGIVHRTYWARPIDAVSAALTSVQLTSEFTVESQIRAQSDWLVNFPTRRHYVDARLGSADAPPFVALSEQPAILSSCDPRRFTPFDRESHRPTGSTEGAPGPRELQCYASQVYSVGSTLSVLLSPARMSLSTFAGSNTVFASGVFEMDLRSRPLTAIGGERISGLPAIGFAATSYRNVKAESGQLGTYSSAIPHRAFVECVRPDGSLCPGL